MMKTCQNCKAPLNNNDSFCPVCGQRVNLTMSAFSLIATFFETVFNYDSKIFRSLRHLAIPAKLPRAFREGRRTSYVHPFRLFFITLILFFAVLALNDHQIDIGNATMISPEYTSFKDDLHALYDSVSAVIDTSCSQQIRDSIGRRVFATSPINSDTIQAGILKLFTKDSLRHTVSGKDALKMSATELKDKYPAYSSFELFVIKQQAKITSDLEGSIQFFISNMLWGILIMVLMISFFQKLAFFRSKAYYLEHLVIQNYVHSLLFMVLTLLYGMKLIFKWESTPDGRIGLLVIIYYIMTLKQYFKLGIMGTLWRVTLLLILYFVVFIFVCLLIFVLSLLFF